MCNDRGVGSQSEIFVGEIIILVLEVLVFECGVIYCDIVYWQCIVMFKDWFFYEIIEFDFCVFEVCYEFLLVILENVQVFGVILLCDGQCLYFFFDNLVMVDYIYGKWVGYELFYLGDGCSCELLIWNVIDLEYYDFVYIFFLCGFELLVIMVVCWCFYVNEISLVDLWVELGDVLVILFKCMVLLFMLGMSEEEKCLLVVDMYNNCNLVQVCCCYDGLFVLFMVMVLVDVVVMLVLLICFYYYEEKQLIWYGMLCQVFIVGLAFGIGYWFVLGVCVWCWQQYCCYVW